MQTGADSNIIILKLSNGEDVFNSIEQGVSKHNIRSGVIIKGIGMLKEFELGYFNPSGYETKFFEEPHELVSMSGSIAYAQEDESKLLPHIHCTVADSEHRVWGGHLNKGRVNVINEITILKLKELNLTRIKNEDTGLMELNIKEI